MSKYFYIPQGMRLKIPQNSPETSQAGRILSWLDRIVNALPPERQRAYHGKRRITGQAARVRTRWGYQGPVAGSGDDAYGHHRLRAVVREAFIPAIKASELNDELTHQLQRRLRGHYAQLCREVQRALRERRKC